ncbi:class I SAM-dependent methyltransferase [Actinomycetospora endophytica]|uniref:Class I SAM-dependent methyltransferase n=1 Tax=Actinomycetospora endophytica TaxID=2291215 RepID=A0ABS8P1F2_9PSEU|nr:class I SAM-dependent methyltransferase [Actinomycetospora endophytica]MCD2192087.1 class I SAM-dependent methyltransferase [Actinomycetospora endophytica]
MGSSSVRRPEDLDVVRESYDRVADNYVEMIAATGLGDIRAQPWLRAAMDAFADAVAGRGPVLDVGCGPGTVTAYLVDRGVDASGVDLSPRMIEHARRLYPQCRFDVASATERTGLRTVAELRLPAAAPIGPVVVLVARREQ